MKKLIIFSLFGALAFYNFAIAENWWEKKKQEWDQWNSQRKLDSAAGSLKSAADALLTAIQSGTKGAALQVKIKFYEEKEKAFEDADEDLTKALKREFELGITEAKAKSNFLEARVALTVAKSEMKSAISKLSSAAKSETAVIEADLKKGLEAAKSKFSDAQNEVTKKWTAFEQMVKEKFGAAKKFVEQLGSQVTEPGKAAAK